MTNVPFVKFNPPQRSATNSIRIQRAFDLHRPRHEDADQPILEGVQIGEHIGVLFELALVLRLKIGDLLPVEEFSSLGLDHNQQNVVAEAGLLDHNLPEIGLTVLR